MSIHDGLVLLILFLATIGAGALIEGIEYNIKKSMKRKKRS